MSTANPDEKISIGILTAEIQDTTGEFQIFPAGDFRASDGRPKNAAAYRLDESNVAALIADFRNRKNPLMVDYEHQVLLAKENGKPAPAAGRVHNLEWREGKGLFATGVKWTAAAREAIQADEYRYISPVFTYKPGSGTVLRLFNVALTNTPALDGMEAAVAHSLALSNQEPEVDGELASLSVEIHSARSELFELEAAKQRLQEEIAALQESTCQDEIETAVSGYLTHGKLAPAERDAALSLARHDLPALRQLLDNRVSLFSLQSERLGLSGKREAHSYGLTPSDLRACELTGREPEEFAALKAQFFNESQHAEEI